MTCDASRGRGRWRGVEELSANAAQGGLIAAGVADDSTKATFARVMSKTLGEEIDAAVPLSRNAEEIGLGAGDDPPRPLAAAACRFVSPDPRSGYLAPMSDRDRLLGIYLNDHLAGATAGGELARRVRDANRDEVEFGAPLARVCTEIEADRETLVGLMDHLKIRRDPIKPVAAWAVEKLGRLKLNGQLTGYSPLSRQVELEGLLIGITGKEQMWTALARTIGPQIGEFDFAQLAERAEQQRDVVRELHVRAAARALPSS